MTKAAAPAGVLCVGRLYCDLIFTDVPRLPSLGTETFAGGLELHAGGGAYITAAWLASLGHAASLASFLPSGPFTDLIAGDIRRAGVDLGPSRASPSDHAPQLTVSIVTQGDRAFLTHQTGGPCPEITAAVIRAAAARHVHVGELTTLVERPEILAAARAAGVTVSLDCGWRDELETAGLEALLAGVDVFLPNASEAVHLRRLGVSLDLPGLTVVKRGADGASATFGGHTLHEGAAKVSVVDSTGAGDAFNAGFLSAWLAGMGPEECLRAGNATGARAVSGCGGFPTEYAGSRQANVLAP